MGIPSGDGNPELAKLLDDGQVLCHPFVIGELACGNIKNRSEVFSLLGLLPQAIRAEHEEVLDFIESNGLVGTGLGYVDMHLLCSARLAAVPLWTLDKRLDKICNKLDLKYIRFVGR